MSFEGVHVDVISARKLIAADRGGTSDPFARVKLVDGDGKELGQYKTKVIKKTLNPAWNESIVFGDNLDGVIARECRVEVTLMDYDLVGSNDPLGRVVVPLAGLAEQPSFSMEAAHPLEPMKANQRVSGEISLKIRVLGKNAFSSVLENSEDKLPDHETHALEYADEDCNELHVTLIRCRNLLVMDSSLLGKGSSDPYVRLAVHGTKLKSTTKKKNLNPEWNETFVIEADDEDAMLEVTVMDYDLVGSDDFMGKSSIPLRTLKDKLLHREWHPLTNEAGELDQGHGDVELGLWWKHSAKVAAQTSMELSDEEAIAADEDPELPMNELLVALVRGRNLPVMDTATLGMGKGSSDPLVTIRCENAMAKSSTKKKNLNPIWKERFCLPVRDASSAQVSSSSSLGSF